MDILEFISKIVESIAWPFSIIVLIIVFKNPIKDSISLLSSLKYKGFEIAFGKNITRLTEKVNYELSGTKNRPETDELRNRTIKLIQVSPKSAIIEVWRSLESTIIEKSTKNNIALDKALIKSPILLSKVLLKKHLINESQNTIIEDMRKLRNEVVHYDKKEISAENAIEYLDSGIRLISSIKTE